MHSTGRIPITAIAIRMPMLGRLATFTLDAAEDCPLVRN